MDSRDKKIKEILQEDKLISKKADDVFNNFLKGENVMGQEKKIKKFPAWKKGVAAAACLVVVLGGANIYASTNGYGNVFFMIKYLITGEKKEVTDKNVILSDRDITISYEPIQLTENIKMQVRRLQVKDNKATLTLAVHEDELEENDDIVPLRYKITDQSSNTLCEMTSSKEERDVEYIDELELTNFSEDDKLLNLDISKNSGEKITKLVIDIENKTITIEGADEAIKKVSEIELKEFLGLVSAYPELDGTDEDSKILLAINANPYSQSNGTASIGADQIFAIESNRANQLLKEMGYSEISRNFSTGNTFHKTTDNGKEYYQFNFAGDPTFGNTCINISSISYSGGIYKATFTYTNSIGEDGGFNLKAEDMNIFEGTVYFKINDSNEFVKYQITKFEDMITIPYINDEEYIEIPEVDEPTTEPTETSAPASNSNNGKIDNYATSLSWSDYWAPGLRVQYPSDFKVTEYSNLYVGSDVNTPDEKTVELEGDLVGLDVDTKNPIYSHLKITVYMPEESSSYASREDYVRHSYKTIFGEDYTGMLGTGYGYPTDNDFWYEIPYDNNGTHYELYTCCMTDINYGYKILVETDNRSNYKVTNVLNWIFGNIRFTSF